MQYCYGILLCFIYVHMLAVWLGSSCSLSVDLNDVDFCIWTTLIVQSCKYKLHASLRTPTDNKVAHLHVHHTPPTLPHSIFHATHATSSVVLHYHGATGIPHQHWCAKCTLQREHLQAPPSSGFTSVSEQMEVYVVCCFQLCYLTLAYCP